MIVRRLSSLGSIGGGGGGQQSFYGNQLVEKYASLKTTKVTLLQLLAFGRHMNEHKLLKSANYVKKELAVRIGTSPIASQSLSDIMFSVV
jgi:hypothetical protein